MQLPKINIPKKYLKIGAWVLGILIVIAAITGSIAYSKREALLQKMIAKAISKANKDYDLDVKIGKAGFSGLSTVHMTNISVVPKERDTLTTISDMTIGVKLWPLIFGNVKLAEMNLHDGRINLVIKDSLTNIDFILKRKKKDNTEKKDKMALSDIANNLLNQILYKVPDDMEIKNLLFTVNDNDTAKLSFMTTSATIDGGMLQSTILVNSNEATWHVNGEVKAGKSTLTLWCLQTIKKSNCPI